MIPKWPLHLRTKRYSKFSTLCTIPAVPSGMQYHTCVSLGRRARITTYNTNNNTNDIPVDQQHRPTTSTHGLRLTLHLIYTVTKIALTFSDKEVQQIVLFVPYPRYPRVCCTIPVLPSGMHDTTICP